MLNYQRVSSILSADMPSKPQGWPENDRHDKKGYAGGKRLNSFGHACYGDYGGLGHTEALVLGGWAEPWGP